MAETADSVVVELEAKLGNYQAQVNQGANAFEQSMSRMRSSASATEQHVGRSFGNARIAQLELMHVTTAMSDSYAAGIPLTRAFSMEIGRIAEAAQLAGPAMGKFGAVLAGPWGLALQVGIGLLTALLAGHQKAAEGAKKHQDAETVLTDALHGQKVAVEDLSRAVAELRAQEDKALRTEDELIDRRYREADATRAAAIETRKKLQIDLEAERARLQSEKASPSLLTPGGIGSGLGRADVAVTSNRIADLDRQIAEQTRIISDSTARLNDAATEAARSLSSNVGRVERDFDRQQRALEIKYRGGNIDGKPVQGVLNAPGLTSQARLSLTADFAREEDKLRIAREAGTAAARKLDDAETGKGQHSEAAAEAAATSVAYMVKTLKQLIPGAIVTSTTGGKHVAGSDHYKDRAIDFVPPGGMGSMTKDDVRQALEGAGIRIRRNANGVEQLFGPGDKGHSDHFHFAWEGGGPSAETLARRQAADADKAAARQQAADTEIAHSTDALITARRALANTAEAQAALARQDVEADRKAFEDNITAQHNRKKLTDAEFATLKQLNADRAKARLDLVDQQEAERKRREAAQQAQRDTTVATGALDAQADLLQSQKTLADTAAQRRDIELKLLDLQFQEEKIRLQAIIAESDRLNAIQNASEQEQQAAKEAAAAASVARARLATLPARQANAAESVSRQNEGPLAAYRRQLQLATGDMGTAMQSVEVHAFQSLEDGLTSTIAKVLKLKGAFGQMAASIIADLARIEIERAILGATGKSGGLFNSIAKLLGSAGSITGSGSGGGSYIQGSFGDIGARASGGPVVAGTLYRVNEQGTEGFRPAGSGTIVPLGDMPAPNAGGGTLVLQPVSFDLRGAVMTEDILAQMNALAEQAAMRGAMGGLSLTRREMARAQSRRLA